MKKTEITAGLCEDYIVSEAKRLAMQKIIGRQLEIGTEISKELDSLTETAYLPRHRSIDAFEPIIKKNKKIQQEFAYRSN
jgi:hypothetical protein